MGADPRRQGSRFVETSARKGAAGERKLAASAVLRTSEDVGDVTIIALVEAPVWWLEEPQGDEYAYALPRCSEPREHDQPSAVPGKAQFADGARRGRSRAVTRSRSG
jgi:hypothetical protein